MGNAKISLTVVLSILATGATLTLLSQGYGGDVGKKFANFIKGNVNNA